MLALWTARPLGVEAETKEGAIVFADTLSMLAFSHAELVRVAAPGASYRVALVGPQLEQLGFWIVTPAVN